jgi:DNA-binding LytR/AlgR family response regulator
MNTKLKIQISTTSGIELVNPLEIISVSPEKRKTLVYLHNEVKIIAHHGMDEMEKLLDYPWFFRCHKSCIVNLLKISLIEHGYEKLVLICGTTFPISKYRKAALKLALSQLCKSNRRVVIG